LEDRLARLQADYDAAQAALAQCQLGVVNNPATFASLGSVTALLGLAYLGGVYWRRHFGPDGPDYPLDR
jgi:hypothetical protein